MGRALLEAKLARAFGPTFAAVASKVDVAAAAERQKLELQKLEDVRIKALIQERWKPASSVEQQDARARFLAARRQVTRT